MSGTRCGLAILAGTFVLIIWYGLAQFFPWGAGSVSNFSATTDEPYTAGAPGLEEAEPGTFTTEAFEERLGGRISTLATDHSFSWIIAAPRETYSFPRYLGFHALAQAGVAALLGLLVCLLAPLARAHRLAVVAVFSVVAGLTTYGGMLNWWGMPAGYGVGESFNLLVGWVLAYTVIERIGTGGPTAQQA